MSSGDSPRDADPVSSSKGPLNRRPRAKAGRSELPPAPESVPAPRFRKLLMEWYRAHARQLPWRGIHDPYATWLSEIMLQQTRVATVIERYDEFLRRFPTLKVLAAAREDDVLALWSGLGYYRRARMLHRGAQFVDRELRGKLPETSTELRTLPGIGEYTAAAIASIAFGERIAVVDGNVERVLLRILGLGEDRSAAGRAQINAAAQKLVPPAAKAAEKSSAKSRDAGMNPPGDHNQAMMELGATICLPRQPLCLQCPVVSLCRTRGEHITAPRGRQQSRLAVHLLAIRKRGRSTEVLMEKRAKDASLMPGMLELPPLPPSSVEGREPVLRLRHGITNTNYVVQVYSEAAKNTRAPLLGTDKEVAEGEHAQGDLPGVPARAPKRKTRRSRAQGPGAPVEDEDAVFEVSASEEPDQADQVSLLKDVPAAPDNLVWLPISRLRELPLTGLARKCLQRLRLMPVDLRHSQE